MYSNIDKVLMVRQETWLYLLISCKCEKSVNFGGSNTKVYDYVEDVARVNNLGLKDKGGIYNIGTGIKISVIDIYNKLNYFFGKNVIAEYKREKNCCTRNKLLGFQKNKRGFRQDVRGRIR